MKQFGSDQARGFVGPGLCPNCLQKLAPVDTNGQALKFYGSLYNIVHGPMTLNQYLE